VDDPICTLLGDSEEHCDITVDHLLQFASGLDWKEVYENESNQASSVLAMLYGQGHGDWASFVLSHGSRAAPGSRFSYSTGDSTLLLSAVHRAIQKTHGRDWPWSLLFEPIGLRSAVFERDARGNLGGGSYFYATARDYLRLGYLYLRDGCWDGQRLLPEDWVARSTTISEALYATDRHDRETSRRQWWLNRPCRRASTSLEGRARDTYAAIGHWGQYVIVVPSEDTVIVRLADDRDETFDLSTFTGLALAIGAVP
jgi:CubicO group peptidase (beta-lactamase class C family)